MYNLYFHAITRRTCSEFKIEQYAIQVQINLAGVVYVALGVMWVGTHARTIFQVCSRENCNSSNWLLETKTVTVPQYSFVIFHVEKTTTVHTTVQCLFL